MAQKKITDLTLRTNFDATCILPADDTAQTWRVTGQQIRDFVAPITTQGDALVGGSGGVAQRLALGAAGKVLRSNGTNLLTDFPTPTIASKTANYTVVANDNLLLGDSSGGAFTFTLPAAAAGNAGQRYFFKKTDSSFTAITISDGTYSTTLNSQNENIEVYSTGAAWALLRRGIESTEVSYTPTFTGLGTVASSSVFYRREGSALYIQGEVVVGTPTGVTAKVSIPSGLTFGSSLTIKKMVGASVATDSVAVYGTVLAETANDGVLQFGRQTGSTSGYTAATGSTIVSGAGTIAFFAKVQISGWNG